MASTILLTNPYMHPSESQNYLLFKKYLKKIGYTDTGYTDFQILKFRCSNQPTTDSLNVFLRICKYLLLAQVVVLRK